MKKLLLCIITILMILLISITIFKGIKIGKLNILGIVEIKNRNEELDKKINEATKLASSDYQRKINDLNDVIKKLENEKNNYQDMVSVSTESEVQAASQTYDYQIEFLWITIENHAKSEGVKMKMELTRSSSGAKDVYNLNFTATGSYIGIEEFITDIEDDSKLGFKIEDFKMTAESSEDSNTVQATFTCKDISIEGISTNSVNTGVTNRNTDNNIENTLNNTTE